MNGVFVTGAGGFVGRNLLLRLPEAGVERALGLVRRPPEHAPAGPIQLVVGDLLDPAGYRDALRGCDAVVHLAAVTGKARLREFERVNVEGTRRLVETCRAEGVEHLLHVSTIAAKFPDRRFYHYAETKRRAEEIVAASGLHYTIVRPTIILGPGAPVVAGLARLAAAPIMPVFGSGTVAVQPITVADLVGRLLAILKDRRFRGETLELGGPEVLTMEELMNRVRRLRFGKPPRSVHLPLGPIRGLLGLVEPVLFPLLPLTAGQLGSFANDGTACAGPDPIAGHETTAEIAAALRGDSADEH